MSKKEIHIGDGDRIKIERPFPWGLVIVVSVSVVVAGAIAGLALWLMASRAPVIVIPTTPATPAAVAQLPSPATPTPIATPTATPIVTPTPAPTPTVTPTPTPTVTPTLARTYTSTPSPAFSPTPTAVPVPSPRLTPAMPAIVTPVAAPATPMVSVTPVPTTVRGSAAPGEKSILFRNISKTSTSEYEPRITSLADGRLWAVWGTYGRDLWQSTSTDGGATWSTPEQLPTRKMSGWDVNPSMTQAKDGVWWLVWANQPSADIYYMTSLNGRAWSEPKRLTTDGYANEGPSLTQAADGSIWVVWISTRPPQNTANLWYLKSEDNGRSWSKPQSLTTDTFMNKRPKIMLAKD